MQINRIIQIMTVGILVTGICSCSNGTREIAPPDNETGEPMTLIIDNDMYPTDDSQDENAAQQSRTMDVGFTTKFIKDDKVGVFVSKIDGTFENIEFTYNSQGWTPSGTLKYYDRAQYTTYYPYNRLITNKTTYDKYITNFTPTANQGSAALYSANDPLWGVGAISGTTQARVLKVKLSHLMGLCVIYPPEVNIVPIFKGGVATYMVDGSYRYHVKPGSNTAITGSCQIDGVTKGFSVTPTIAANKYSIFRLKDTSTTLADTKTISINGVNFKFILVKKGVFQMGSPTDEEGRSQDETQHWVSLTKDYYISETEITSAQWNAIEEGPGKGGNTTPLDAFNVSWDVINKPGGFLDKIHTAYKGSDGRFALPTEAQWEYAARGGHKKGTDYMKYPGTHTDLDAVAFYGNQGESKVQSVAKKQANKLGLYDMAGNMAEICRDYYKSTYDLGPSEQNPAVDPFVDKDPGTNVRVLRGGGYSSTGIACRSAKRSTHTSDSKGWALGFRLVLEP